MQEPLLRVHELRKVYQHSSSLSSRRQDVDALAGISFDLCRGETMAVVGRSGSGKSTLAQCLASYIEPTSGDIYLGAQRILSGQAETRVQLVFQDSPAALNPRWSGLELLDEPLRVQGFGSRAARRERVLALAERVGLPRPCLKRRPKELSGGERQRLAIARALSIKPIDVLILDEPLRGLDAASKDYLLDLLTTIPKLERSALLYVSHDLASVGRIAGRMMVLDHGQVVESGLTGSLLATPKHPTTQALVEAIIPEPSCAS